MFGVMGIFLYSGCASFRVLTDLKPEADATLQSSAGRFYIAGLKYKDFDPTKPYTDFLVVHEQRLLTSLRIECLARYPLLFTKDSIDSIPLWIKLDDSLISKGDRFEWMFGTLFMAPYFLPLPTDRERNMTVAIGTGTSREGFNNVAIRKDFNRKEHGWFTIFSPLALIAIPGESDFPKVSVAFNNKGLDIYDYVPQVAQQVATAIAKLVAAKDSEFWTTQPRLNTPSIMLPTQTGDVPVASPLPTDSVAPF
jgi:hypothetical protein